MAGTGDDQPSPYVGLRPYTDRESAIFFGRERERRIVSSNLVASRLTLLYGPSGVGKSSILNAAVVPHLRAVAAEQAGDDEEAAFTVVAFNAWRDDPVPALIRQVAGAAADVEVPLAAVLRAWTDEQRTDLLVVLDQFEEYFLYHGGSGGTDRFARELPDAVNDPALRVNFLVSFREDALARLDLFKGRVPRLLAALSPDRAALVSARFDPVGTTVVTAGADGVARLWDTASGRVLHELRGHTSILTGASFDPTGAHVVTSSADGTARVWDAGTGQELARMARHDGRVERAVFSPDGTFVATAGRDGNAYVWQWRSGEATVLSGHTNQLASVQFDHTGDRVVTAGDKTARVWDARTGRLLTTLLGHGDWLTAAVFSSDGRRVATAGQDGSARVWDLATGTTLAALRGHREIVWDVAFSPADDRVLATAGSDATARLWELPGQETLAHQGWVVDARFSPDGRSAVTSGNDRTVRVWDVASGRQETALTDHQGQVLASFSPDGRLVVTIDDHRTRVWDRGGGPALAETAELRRGIARFTPSGDGVIISDEDGTIYRWDWMARAPLKRLTGYRGVITVTDMELSADGRWIVTAGSDRVARVWDIGTGRERTTLRGHDGVLYSAQFSEDGRFVVTAGADGSARVWDAASGRQLRSLVADRPLHTAAFDPTGTRVVAGAVDGSIRIWDAHSGRTLSVLARHTDTVNSAVFSPDGRQVLSASDDWTAAVYGCETCDSIATLRARAERLLGRVEEPRDRAVREWALVPGDCYDGDGAYARLRDCRSLHRSEAFAVVEDPSGYGVAFDETRATQSARRQCEGVPFTAYVGVPVAGSRYRVSVWMPTSQTWNAGDRRVVCAVYGSGPSTGSARLARR